MKRKIAAILAADVVEYSRLVAEDEEETLRRLVSYRSVFDDFVTKADGRIFNTAGDAVLAEFPSAVDALRAAIDIQESLRTRNMAYPPSRHMQFRMGLTVGDVVEREVTYLAMASTSLRDCKGWRSPVAFACRAPFTNRSPTSFRFCSTILDRKRSRTSRHRCTSIVSISAGIMRDRPLR